MPGLHVRDEARVPVLVVGCVAVVLAAGCDSTPPAENGSAVTTTPGGQAQQPAFLEPTAVSLPGGCAEPAVAARLDALARDVSRGDGAAVAAHFLAGPDLRWEVDEHADPPNGTRGALRTPDAIAGFVVELHERGEVWASDGVAPPVRREQGSPAVYAFRIAITSGGRTTEGGAKAVVDCPSGLLSHLVGPGT